MFWELPEIRIAPEELFHIGPMPVTNTMFCAWITLLILVIVGIFATRRRDMIPSGFQNFFEWCVEMMIGMVEGIVGKKKGKVFFPLVGSFFVFIVVANLLDVIPGVDTVGMVHSTAHDPLVSQPVAGFLLFGKDSNNLIPWIRPATTDLNMTIALALVSVITTQIFGFYYLGWKEHLSRYLNFPALRKFPMGLIDFLVGLIEIISEIGRIISFSFRLFGNIFAGSVLLTVFAFLAPVVTTIIFVPFEIFVGVIQGFVFALLTTIFMEMATTSHHVDHGNHEPETHEGENKATAHVSAH